MRWRRLQSHPVDVVSWTAQLCPKWSPDGRSILFDSNPEGHYGLFLVDSQGGAPKRLTTGPSNAGNGTFSRDGKWIYFASDRTGQWQIWKMPVHPDGGDTKAVQVTRNGAVSAIESPDGKYLYWVKEGNPSSLIKTPVEGGEEIQVLPSVFHASFAVADEGIYFIPDPNPNRFSLQFLSFSSRKITRIADVEDPGWGVSVSPGPPGAARSILYTQKRRVDYNLMLVENFR